MMDSSSRENVGLEVYLPGQPESDQVVYAKLRGEGDEGYNTDRKAYYAARQEKLETGDPVWVTRPNKFEPDKHTHYHYYVSQKCMGLITETKDKGYYLFLYRSNGGLYSATPKDSYLSIEDAVATVEAHVQQQLAETPDIPTPKVSTLDLWVLTFYTE